MQDSTKALNETTENLLKAFNDFIANPPEVKKTVTRLIYDPTDGKILDITVGPVKDGESWIEIDNDLLPEYFSRIKYLRYIDGKIINTRVFNDSKTVQLVPGDTWHADNEYRLITGEPGVNTSGWSRKTD